MLSGHEMLDQDFSDDGEAMSENHRQALEVQLMDIDSDRLPLDQIYLRNNNTNDATAPMMDLSLAEAQKNHRRQRRF